MRKKYLIFSIVIVVIISIVCVLSYYLYNIFQPFIPIKNEIDLQTLSGKIILENTIDNREQKGIVIYTPCTGNKEEILNDYIVYNAEISKTNNKLLMCGDSENYVFEYDLKSKKITPIIKNVAGGIHDLVKYLPNEDSVCYADNKGLHLFNKLNKVDNLILNDIETVSWAKDSTTFIYSKANENNAYKYNILKKEEQFLFSGYNPQYSNDDKLIAYLPQYMDKTLIITDQSTGKQWEYITNSGIIEYTFSPDNNYIAIVELSKKVLLSPMSGPVVIWDFKNNKKSILFENYYGKFIDWK